MALRAGYKGFKKLKSPLILNRPGTVEIDSDALNVELNTVFFPRSEQAVLGAVNLFNNTAITDTVGGIVCTVNADKTVSASGTYSGGTYVQFTLGRVSVKAGQILKGCPSGGSTSTYQLILFNSAQSARLATDLGDGAVISADDSNALLAIYFHASVTDKVFKPQICLSMDTPYAPYAMTNRELTEKAFIYKGVVPANTNLNDLTASGIYVCDGNAITNAPSDFNGYGKLEVIAFSGLTLQIIYGTGVMYTRIYAGSTWRNWFKFTGTEMTPQTMQAAAPETREAAPEDVTPEEEPVTVKKSTRKKSTAAAETEKEGE